MHPAFQQTDHRPWPHPTRPWTWQQQWLDLVFIHFEVNAAVLRKKIPAGLELDLHQGKAWIGIVPFRMEGVTKRGFPAPSLFCAFPEINVRTYVTAGGKPGVWFFSLDVPGQLAVWAARTFFHLPYFRADIDFENTSGGFNYSVRRGAHHFDATYSPEESCPSQRGSFEYWATERYCLYACSGNNRLFRAEVQHGKWPLQKATLALRSNALAEFPLGEMHPSVLFSRKLDVVVWPLSEVD